MKRRSFIEMLGALGLATGLGIQPTLAVPPTEAEFIIEEGADFTVPEEKVRPPAADVSFTASYDSVNPEIYFDIADCRNVSIEVYDDSTTLASLYGYRERLRTPAEIRVSIQGVRRKEIVDSLLHDIACEINRSYKLVIGTYYERIEIDNAVLTFVEASEEYALVDCEFVSTTPHAMVVSWEA